MIKLVLLAQIVAGMMYGGPAQSPMNPDQAALINRIKAQEATILQMKTLPDSVNNAHQAVTTCYKFRADKPGHCTSELSALDSAIGHQLGVPYLSTNKYVAPTNQSQGTQFKKQ